MSKRQPTQQLLLDSIHIWDYNEFKRLFKSYDTSGVSQIVLKIEVYQLLFNAVKFKYPLILKLILEKFPRLLFKPRHSKDLIEASITSGHIDTLKVLLEVGTVTNADYMSYIRKEPTVTFDFSALHHATQRGNLEVIKLLIKNGAHVNARDCRGKTPLHIVAGDNPLLVEYFIREGSNVNARDTLQLQTSLHIAVNKKNVECVNLLLANGAAEIMIADKTGETVLHYAARGSAELLRLILDHKRYDINCKDNNGDTPVHFAVEKSLKNTKLLLAYGADVNANNRHKDTPLFYAIQKGYKNVINYLLSNYKITTEVDLKDEAALTILCNFHDVFSRLLMLGFDVNSLLKDGPAYVEALFDISETRGSVILTKEIALAVARNDRVDAKYLEIIARTAIHAELYRIYEKMVQSMMAEKIEDTTISYFNICTKDVNQLIRYMSNEKVVKALLNQDYKVTFPNYADKIVEQFKIGKEAKLTLDKCIKNCYFVFAQVPVTCFEKVLSFLAFSDIINLIEACKLK